MLTTREVANRTKIKQWIDGRDPDTKIARGKSPTRF